MAETQSPQKPGTYDFRSVEPKWQQYWDEHDTFTVANPGDRKFDPGKPKCYVLDMFPYPSGAGLHVGHPLGYCATDIYSRYKRMRGFNVLHPIGYDAFGLPAEQYAIEHGVHPAVTTRKNIENMRRQLKMFGFSYDWRREISTCEPGYYKHTQWIFLQMFNSWFDDEFAWTDDRGRHCKGGARPISELESALARGAVWADDAMQLVRNCTQPHREWSTLTDDQKRQVINNQRLAYIDEIPVNWCPALGTVLANEEVTADGRSDRGSHPVFRRPLRQWMLRITRYAERLLNDLGPLDWPEPIKIMQRNWIGRSTGADVDFPLVSGGPEAPTVGDEAAWREARKACGFAARPEEYTIRVYTTRPDTLFGATYMVLAPEHPLVDRVTTPPQKADVGKYVTVARHKSDLDRTAETKEKTGVFTGAYALNPVNGEKIPVWVADYVLMGYGTGAIMAVPGHDTRDFEFAKQFDLPIVAVVQPDDEWLREQIQRGLVDADYCAKKGKPDLPEQLMDSASRAAGTIAGITAQDATAILDGDDSWINQVALPLFAEDPGVFVESFVGEGTSLNSPAPDATASLPDDVCDINALPTTEANDKITRWLEKNGLGKGAVNYKLRDWVFSRQKYWGEPFPVLHGPDGEIIAYDEHDLPLELPPMKDFKPTPVAADSDAVPEPPLGRATDWVTVQRDGKTYRHDLNTMPQWAGSCWYYLRYLSPDLSARVSDAMAEDYWMPVDVYVGGAEHAVLHLLYARFWHKVLFDLGSVSTNEPFMKLVNQGMIQSFAYKDRRGVLVTADQVEELADGTFKCKKTGEPVEQVVAKMSKALKNVVNPDDIIERFGADTFRLYEMFMGPIEASKPWNTRDVPGVFKLVGRIWRLVVDEETGRLSPALVDDPPDEATLRLLHKTIKRVGDDIEQLKFNTAIARFFDFVNQLTPRDRRPRAVVEPFILLLAPFAPHVAEELWQRLGHKESLAHAPWPTYDQALARDEAVEIAVQVNGKVKSRITVPVDADEKHVEQLARADETVGNAIAGKTVRRVIVVGGRLVNFVVG
ncbi:MAG: leucine--tRNA ligase [Phycisphaerales bacterium]|nr:MAG: leucine--tRNA ligase [Phycisphaerales bacterium]